MRSAANECVNQSKGHIVFETPCTIMIKVDAGCVRVSKRSVSLQWRVTRYDSAAYERCVLTEPHDTWIILAPDPQASCLCRTGAEQEQQQTYCCGVSSDERRRGKGLMDENDDGEAKR